MTGEFGGAERIALLRAMLVELNELGARCVVVSFNSKDTIGRALRVVDLIDYFDAVYGSEHELLEGLGNRGDDNRGAKQPNRPRGKATNVADGPTRSFQATLGRLGAVYVV